MSVVGEMERIINLSLFHSLLCLFVVNVCWEYMLCVRACCGRVKVHAHVCEKYAHEKEKALVNVLLKWDKKKKKKKKTNEHGWAVMYLTPDTAPQAQSVFPTATSWFQHQYSKPEHEIGRDRRKINITSTPCRKWKNTHIKLPSKH